jgi:hypothetical protein
MVESGRQYLDNTEDNWKDPELRDTPGHAHLLVEEHAVLNGALTLDLVRLAGLRPLEASDCRSRCADESHRTQVRDRRGMSSTAFLLLSRGERNVFVTLRADFDAEDARGDRFRADRPLLRLLIALAFRFFGIARKDAAEYLVMGRRLALPSFVATLVTTWYGGILGVGEFTYRYGISNWLVFGLPYYVGAALFALLVARLARRSRYYTVPDRSRPPTAAPPRPSGRWSSRLSPARPLRPHARVLLELIFGIPLTGNRRRRAALDGLLDPRRTRSVVSADAVQFVLMYLGFRGATASRRAVRRARIPEAAPARDPLVWHGGNPPQYIFVWYLIALQTLVEPTFYQRAFAATDERSRGGVLISIAFWMLFDFLTTATGLYARASAESGRSGRRLSRARGPDPASRRARAVLSRSLAT